MTTQPNKFHILRGKDGERFLDAMIRKQNTPITQEELKLVELIKRLEPICTRL